VLSQGAHVGPSPVDRARPGSKHHLIVDAHGIPLAISLTDGNRNDVTQLLPLVDGVGPVAGRVGRPRQRTDRVIADRGYDHDKYRRALWDRGIKPVIARRNTEHGSGLGKLRWVVERTFSWLHQFRGYESAGNATPPCTSPAARSSATINSRGSETGS
jgi:transposase